MQYKIALQFFSQVLQQSPVEVLLQSIVRESLFESFQYWGCFRASDKAVLPNCSKLDSKKAILSLVEAYSFNQKETDDEHFFYNLYLDLHRDHLALFSGPMPKSPPWESVWLEKEKLLFGKQTQKVYSFYLDWGISIEKAGQEPEDHLGLELAFVLFLLQILQSDPSRRSKQGLDSYEALVKFLDTHILLWAPLCLTKAAENANTVFYRTIPVLCCSMLCNLRNDLEVSRVTSHK